MAAGDVLGFIGLGVMGQLHVVLARHLGARQVIAADLVADRCRRAGELGADVVIDASQGDLVEQVLEVTDGHGAEIVVAVIDASQHERDRMRTDAAPRCGRAASSFLHALGLL